MSEEERLLTGLRRALRALDEAQRDRATTWALAGSGLLDPGASRTARMHAEREINAARETLRKARGSLDVRTTGEKAWGGH